MKSKSRRGVSIVISALLILAITTVGALFLSNIINTSALTTVSQTPKDTIAANSLKLTAYDTRDFTKLSAITSLNNEFDSSLCTENCAGLVADKVPKNGGTEFIVLQLRNKNTNSVTIQGIQINGVLHTWDSNTKGKTLNANADDSSGNYPLSGKFSVIPPSNTASIKQRTSTIINGDEEVRIVIKLSPSIQPDFKLGDSVQVLVNIGTSAPAKYVILTGDTK